MSDTLVEQIEDYIRDALLDVSDLNDVKAFATGYFMTDIEVPLDAYPFGAIVVDIDINQGEMTGSYSEEEYRGTIMFIGRMATLGNADWPDIIQRRVIDLPTRRQILGFLQATADELRKCTHKDLGELVSDSKAVVAFRITEITWGMGQDRRTNNWEGAGVIRFIVETEEQNL